MRVQRRLWPKTGGHHRVRGGAAELGFRDALSRTRNASIVASTIPALRFPSIRVREHPPIASPPEMLGTRSVDNLMCTGFNVQASSHPTPPNLPLSAAA